MTVPYGILCSCSSYKMAGETNIKMAGIRFNVCVCVCMVHVKQYVECLIKPHTVCVCVCACVCVCEETGME